MERSSRASLAAAGERLESLIRERGASAGLVTLAEQLHAVARLLHDQVRLARALSDSASPQQARRQLVDRLFGGQLEAPALDTVRDLVAERWTSPGDLVEATERLAAEASLADAEQEGRLDEVEDELFRFARTVEREPRLGLALTDRALPADRKTAVLDRLLDGRASATTVRLLRWLVSGPHAGSLERSIDELAEQAAARRRSSIAAVTAARPLTEEQTARLTTVLRRLYGRPVNLQVDVDPAVLGGLVIRVGDEVLDGSVLRRLTDAHRRFRR